MSEMRFLVIFQAIMVTLTFLDIVTKTESRRAGSGSTVSISIEDVSTKLKIKKAGVRWGLKECQRLFKDELWDCSFYNKSVTGALPDFVQRTLPYANKETAFLHAITTAGILREIVSQCAANKITECICEKKAGRTSRCGNNLSFAMKATRNLTRNGKKGNNERREIEKKNQEVGIEVFKTNYERNCRGRVLRNCNNWQEVANELKLKYKSAKKTNSAQQQIIGIGKIFRRSRLVLTYQDSSPDYCERNETVGSPGLEGRVCGNNGKRTPKCVSLCAQCGLRSKKEQLKGPGNCKNCSVRVCRQRGKGHRHNHKGQPKRKRPT